MLGRYELLERIAVGGMAEVFRGRVVGAAGFEKHVAIKRILPAFSRDERFIKALVNEAKIASSMSQANIVQMHDVGVAEDGQYFLVMEFVDGRDLRTVLEHLSRLGRRLSQDLAMFVVAEISEALEYVHRHTDQNGNPLRLVHRDVSPPNILISRNGEVKLADFGIAKRAHEQSVVSTLKGKFSYMSPEQSRLAPLDHTTDVFSLGAVLYELVCGRRAFAGASDLETLLLVREARFVQPREIEPSVPPALEEIIARALALRPRDRFQSAAEMGAALREVRFSQVEAGAGAVDLARLMDELFPPDVARAVDPPRRDFITLSTMVRRDPVPPPPAQAAPPAPAATAPEREEPPGPAMGPLPQPPGARIEVRSGGRTRAPGRVPTDFDASSDSVVVEVDHLLGVPHHRETPPPIPAPSAVGRPPRERRETPTAKFEAIAKDLRGLGGTRATPTPITAPPIPLTNRKPAGSSWRTVAIAVLFGAVGAAGALGAFVLFGGVRLARDGAAPAPPDAAAALAAPAPPPDAPAVAAAPPSDAAVPADAPPAPSWVTLRSEPTGARVELDDQPLCVTSCGKEVAAGRRRFRFFLGGYQPWSEVIDLSPGENRELRVRLSALDRGAASAKKGGKKAAKGGKDVAKGQREGGKPAKEGKKPGKGGKASKG